MSTSPQATPCSIHDAWPGTLPPNVWSAFNLKLNRDVERLPNETTIGQRLEELLQLPVDDPLVFWLSFGRLAEMTLKLAGDYADHCEFQGAGDLLANPRQIDVYRRGQWVPIMKHRHSGLSVQFGADIGQSAPVAWLMRESQVHIRKSALLPYFRQILATCGYIQADYLDGLDRRMCRVADTIAFLMAWQVSDQTDLVSRIEAADPSSRTFIQSNLCRFGHTRFHAMGEDILRWIVSNDGHSRFFK